MKKVSVIIIMFLGLLFVNCTKQDRENTIIAQEAAIDSYISSLSSAEVVRNGGSNRVVMISGTPGTEAVSGDSLYIRYAGYIFSNGKGALFVTNDSIVGRDKKFPLQKAPLKIKLGETALVDGLELGLDGVKKGEHCYIIFSAKYGFNNTSVSNIPKLTPLFYEVWVDEVIK